MKKLILLLILFSAVHAQSQTYTGDKFNARIWMKSPLYFKGTDTLVSKLDTAGALKFGSLSPYMWNKINTGGASQWTTAGSDIYYDGGNVGIGQDSTNYNRQLNINGINAITGYRQQGIISMVDIGTAYNNFTIRQSANGHIRLQTDYKNDNSHIGFNLGNTSYSAVVIRRNSSGNPFIGIRAPASEEPGSLTYESKITNSNDGLTISSNRGYIVLSPYTNLGIDKVPSYKLDVDGQINSLYYLLNGTSFKKGIDTVSTSLSTGLLKVTNGTGLLSTAVAGTDYQAALTNPVTGTGSSGALAVWNGTGTITNATVTESSGALAAITTIATSGAVTCNYPNTSNTVVGAFSSVAASAATVVLTERNSPVIAWKANAWNTTPTASSKSNQIVSRLRGITGTTTSGRLVFENYLVDGISNTNELFGIHTGGNIFIGSVFSNTVLPQSKLHIDGGTATSSSIQFTANATTGQTATDGTKLTINTDGSSEINNQENTSFVIKTNNTTATTIDNLQNLTQVGTLSASNLESNATSKSVRLGIDALMSENEASARYNTAIGHSSGKVITTHANNTLVGYQTGFKLTDSDNTMIGSNAGANTTTGNSNTFIGSESGITNTTGDYNVLVGKGSGSSFSTSSNNVVIGYTAGNNIENNNVIIGYRSGNTLSDSANVVMGSEALYTATSSYMGVHIGRKSGYYITTGDYNTGVGWLTNSKLTTGSSNTALGCQANRNTTGSSNTSVGNAAGINTDGSYNTFIGAESSSSTANTGSSNVFIGYKAGFYTLNKSNRFALGNASSGSAALDSTNQLMWGMFNNSNLTKQYLRVNGKFINDAPHVTVYRNTDLTISATQNIWYKVTGFTAKLTAVGTTITGDSIQLNQKGHYNIDFTTSFSGLNNEVWEIAIFKNGVMEEPSQLRYTSSSDVGNVSCPVEVASDGDDWISFRIRNTTDNDDPTIKRFVGRITTKHLEL